MVNDKIKYIKGKRVIFNFWEYVYNFETDTRSRADKVKSSPGFLEDDKLMKG